MSAAQSQKQAMPASQTASLRSSATTPNGQPNDKRQHQRSPTPNSPNTPEVALAHYPDPLFRAALPVRRAPRKRNEALPQMPRPFPLVSPEVRPQKASQHPPAPCWHGTEREVSSLDGFDSAGGAPWRGGLRGLALHGPEGLAGHLVPAIRVLPRRDHRGPPDNPPGDRHRAMAHQFQALTAYPKE